MTRMLLGSALAGGALGTLWTRGIHLSETQMLLLLGAVLVIGAARVKRRLGVEEA
ncbi:hypothetical protein [Deferrisoma sp.]